MLRRASVAAILAVIVSATITITGASPAQAAAPRTPKAYFGAHHLGIGYEGKFPGTRAVGSVRLWDTGTAWRQINPAPGVWEWWRLDQAVDTARANGAKVTLVLGQTPIYAARDLFRGTVYGDSAGSFPENHATWVEYVQRVASRYKGRIEAYETWNEANLNMYSGMTAREMARLQSLAYRTIKRIDPKAIVTAPSVTARGGTGRRFLIEFAKHGGFRYADVINLHAYPEPEAGPERAIELIEDIKRALAKRGVRKPVWDTEINYGLPWGGNGLTVPLTAAQQKAFVQRTYLLHRDAGVKRVHWYAWMDAPFLGVTMTDGSAGMHGLNDVRSWMAGRFEGCTNKGTRYRCTIRFPRMGKTGVARWDTAGSGLVRWRVR